jgi:hypothetical protein
MSEVPSAEGDEHADDVPQEPRTVEGQATFEGGFSATARGTVTPPQDATATPGAVEAGVELPRFTFDDPERGRLDAGNVFDEEPQPVVVPAQTAELKLEGVPGRVRLGESPPEVRGTASAELDDVEATALGTVSSGENVSAYVQPASPSAQAFDPTVRIESPPSSTAAMGAAVGGPPQPVRLRASAPGAPPREPGDEAPGEEGDRSPREHRAAASFTAQATMSASAEVTSPGAAVVVVARRVTVGVEHLVTHMLDALRDENSRLRQELDAANVRIRFLETAIEQLNEAKATGRKPILYGALGFISGIFVSVAGGAASGVAQGLMTGPTNVVVEAPPPEKMSAIEFWRECEALRVEVQGIEGEHLPGPE